MLKINTWLKKVLREYNNPYPEYKKARRKGLIEAGILPLTDALYSLGFYLIASCEGHVEKNEKLFLRKGIRTVPFQPYVYFECANSEGEKIKNTVEYLKSKLKIQWCVSQNGDEKWSIKASCNDFTETQRILLTQDILLLSEVIAIRE